MVTGEEPISRWLGISPTKFEKKNLGKFIMALFTPCDSDANPRL